MKEAPIKVFVSYKDRNSDKLKKYISCIPDYKKYISFYDIHKHRDMVKKHKITQIPLVIYEDDRFLGNDTWGIIKHVLNIVEDGEDEQGAGEQRGGERSELAQADFTNMGAYTGGDFANPNQPPPRISSIAAIDTTADGKLDLDERMRAYNDAKKNLAPPPQQA
jgi:glutaredoxin-related protein